MSWIAYNYEGVPLVRSQNQRAMAKYVRANLDKVKRVTDPQGVEYIYERKTAQLITKEELDEHRAHTARSTDSGS
jgi:hypothetical protein